MKTTAKTKRTSEKARHKEQREAHEGACCHPNGGEHMSGNTYSCVDCGERYTVDLPIDADGDSGWV